MKILGGTARGMKLSAPPGQNTRPMNARIKEALFNILGGKIEGATVLDLFAGSGSLGLEALSRGAEFCSFVEKKQAAFDCLHKNIVKTGFTRESEAACRNAFAIDDLPTVRFHLCFFDPPYRYFDDPVSRKRCMDFLLSLVRLHGHDFAEIVLHYRRGAMSGVPVAKPLEIADRREYGSTELMFLEKSQLP